MWAAIQNLIQPTSLSEACSSWAKPESVYLAGGSYLLAERPEQIHTLINLSPLLGTNISTSGEELVIAAGVSLQQLLEYCKDNKISECIRYSCASKNLRNQRTIGGEIARKRLNSEIYAALYALNAKLHIFNGKQQWISIREWSGEGIIIEVNISLKKIQQLILQRFAVLTSAAAFVIVCAVRNDAEFECVVAGKTSQLHHFNLRLDEFNAEKLQEASARIVADGFPSDHYGSQEYKQVLIRVALQRLKDF